MPTWGAKPEDVLNGSIEGVWASLNTEISDNPPFEQVVGMPLETLLKHATEAISELLAAKVSGLTPSQMMAGAQIYCLGFVVGAKYREQVPKPDPGDITSPNRRNDAP